MLLEASQTAAVIVDMQERLMPAMHEREAVTKKVQMLLRGLQVLDVPVLVPRQYPKGLGDTVEEIRGELEAYDPIDKIHFGVCGEPAFMERLRALGRKNILLCGVEAHICVLNSVMGLVENGYQPVLVCDGIDSRSPYDKEIAIRRAAQEGALLTTVEAALFEMTVKGGDDTFRQISHIVK